jgi:galactarate dehydratase
MEKPLYIKVNPEDNVAIIVNEGGLPAGTAFPGGPTLIEHVPQGHKVALRDISKGEPILRYAAVIGYAAKDIPVGAWIEESLVVMPVAPELDSMQLSGASFPPAPPLEGLTFMGYRNADGTAGVKNLLAIVPSVQCVTGVVLHAVQRIEKELLPKYPNVDGVVYLDHVYGCGVAINATDAPVPIRSLRNLTTHPNFGGEVMIVGLGCEKLLPTTIAPPSAAADIVMLHDEKGFAAQVAKIMRLSEERLERLNARRRESCPVSDLVVGLQCGGSDAFSGVTANPAVGHAADLLVRAGATVMFAEVTEVRDAVYLLTPRAATKEIGEALVREMKWYDDYLDRGGADRSANTSPGNKKGGLANIVEKSLGSIIKSGTGPIVEVAKAGEKPTKKGLVFAATPASDLVCGTELLCMGAHLQVFTTGRGTPYSLKASPVIKVSTNNRLYKQWPDLIDVNAGTIAVGEETIEQVGRRIFDLILDVASGRKKTWGEVHGLANSLSVFNPAPIT